MTSYLKKPLKEKQVLKRSQNASCMKRSLEGKEVNKKTKKQKMGEVRTIFFVYPTFAFE